MTRPLCGKGLGKSPTTSQKPPHTHTDDLQQSEWVLLSFWWTSSQVWHPHNAHVGGEGASTCAFTLPTLRSPFSPGTLQFIALHVTCFCVYTKSPSQTPHYVTPVHLLAINMFLILIKNCHENQIGPIANKNALKSVYFLKYIKWSEKLTDRK